jgi:hypothetical protein
MVGPTAQLVALACHFKGRVRGLVSSPFLQSNSTAQFCEYIQFVRPHQGWIVRKNEWRVAAKTPDEWFAAESRFKRCAILAHHAEKHSGIPDHMLAGFVGDGGQCLSADDPFALVYHKDLAPHGLLSRPASQLLAACQAAWAFGGMGSWNDMSFQGAEQRRYERLSYELYALINRAICAATNSSSA